ncbi:coiled-coil domain-containing protein 117 [Oryzias melastigma]|uniref:Coiled-coil domain containing 117 n=1 Tax=Oryzias melastigma TaxID=30732 RepID=A0A3B3CXM2_ORYME|nr:coiled-coil domain-containing protein 117 [Oryzias melastigma]
MHQPAPSSSELSLLPAMFSFSGPASLTQFDFGPPSSSEHQLKATNSSNNWEMRCLRKHRILDDEGCSAKKRRIMSDSELEISQNSSIPQEWTQTNGCNAAPSQTVLLTPPQSCSVQQNLPVSQPPSLSRPARETFSMEVEATQRKLQEIENRITLEDDDEDLDEEPVQRRPVLVISDSLKEGLERGISDILPHTVTQSLAHSGMELVLWRPPQDPFCQKLKDSLQKQRKQQAACRQLPTPCPSPTPHSPPSSPTETHFPLSAFPEPQTSEEDMEM